MKKLKLLFNISLLVGLFILSSACSTIRTKVANNFKANNAPVRVAILPFNLSPLIKNEKETAIIFRKVFYDYFSYLGYIDLTIKEIDEILAENELIYLEDIYLISPEKLGEYLDVDALIYCDINQVSNITAGIFANTTIEAGFKMVDAHSGSTIWKTRLKERDNTSIIGTASLITLIQEQIDNSKKQEAIKRVAEECSRKVIDTIPDPAPFFAKKLKLPDIYSFNTNVANNGFAGDEFLLKVHINGEIEMKASFDIGNWKSNIPMKEISPGEYTGEYLIYSKDFVEGSVIVGQLENKNGIANKKVYEKGLAWFQSPKISKPQNK